VIVLEVIFEQDVENKKLGQKNVSRGFDKIFSLCKVNFPDGSPRSRRDSLIFFSSIERGVHSG